MWNDAMLVERRTGYMPGKREKESKISALFVTVVGGVLVAAILGAFRLLTSIEAVSSSVERLRTELGAAESRLQKEIAQSKGDTKEYIDFLQDYMFFLNESIYQSNSSTLTSGYVPAGDFQKKLYRSYEKIDSPIFEYTSIISYDSIVVKNASDGRELTLGEIVERKLLLPYSDGDSSSIFYGQLSKNGNWDGRCIINTYKSNKLELITEAQYADGTLITCNQIFPYHTDKEGDVWAVARRTKFDGFSTGDTAYVKRDGDYLMDFELESATTENILTVDAFVENLDPTPVGYYHGNISNGLFNDNTGEAYLVKFFDDGSVRMLYRGKIKNGNIADSSDGSAWFIGREEDDTRYVYTTGPFKNGKAPKNDEYWDPITQEEIQQILNENLILHQWDWSIPSA